MPQPADAKSLQRFIGMVTYLAKFVPIVSDTTAPLRSLSHKRPIYTTANFGYGTDKNRTGAKK